MLHSAVSTVSRYCSNAYLLRALFRFEDAVSKYEAVMKTEPNVHHFSLLAKERICHALAQVRPLSAAMRCINTLFDFIKQCVQTTCFSVCRDQGQHASRAISVCSEVLQSDSENVNVLKDRAEAYVQEEQYEEGKPVG